MRAKTSRPRFNLRTLLAAVAGVAVILWTWETMHTNYAMRGGVGAFLRIALLFVFLLATAVIFAIVSRRNHKRFVMNGYIATLIMLAAWSTYCAADALAYQRAQRELKALFQFAENVRSTNGAYPSSLSQYSFQSPQHASHIELCTWCNHDRATDFAIVWFPGGNRNIHHEFSTASGHYFEDD